MTNEDKAKALGISPEILTTTLERSASRRGLTGLGWRRNPALEVWMADHIHQLIGDVKPVYTPTYEEDPEWHNRGRRLTEWLKLGKQMQQKVPPLHPEIMALLYHEKSQAMFELARDWNIYCESGECERPDYNQWNLLFPWDDWDSLIQEGRLYPINVGELSEPKDGLVEMDVTFEVSNDRVRVEAPAIDTRFFQQNFAIPLNPPEGFKPMFDIKPGGTLNLEDKVKGYSWSIDIEIMPTTMIVEPPERDDAGS